MGSGGAGIGGAQNAADVQTSCASTLPAVQDVDLARADRGEAWLSTQPLAPGLLPDFVVRNLWVAWGTDPPPTDAEYWAQFAVRYGLIEAPFDNGGLPMGVRLEAGGITFDCLLCHGGRVAGTTIVGAPNTRVDLESFYDDLLIMRDLAPAFGFPQPPVPYDLDGFTSAAGAQDAFGLGFRFAESVGITGMNTQMGPQRAPAWWLLRYKRRMYLDGAADASAHRPLMATLVAFGLGPDQLDAREEDFVDIAHFARSIDTRCWNLSEVSAEQALRGEAVYESHCATCHGEHTGPSASYPDRVVALAEVGTDPVRADSFGPTEATYLNASWFGVPPLEDTPGYLAQPLIGIWARAPYFHNGSVPDLVGVLDSTERPVAWRRTGLGTELEDYDADRVGFRYEAVAAPPDPNTREGRQVYDTSRWGMGNGGHTFGDVLTADERSDLLEYLKTL